MERSFKEEVKSLRLGEGETFRGEGILAVTKALLQSGVSYVGGYQGAPISHLIDVLADARDLRSMTERLLLSHAGFADLWSYFRGYAITGERLAALRVPATIVTALDDPIIPAADLARLAKNPALRIVTTETGGHCGFFESPRRGGWIDRFVRAEIDAVRVGNA